MVGWGLGVESTGMVFRYEVKCLPRLRPPINSSASRSSFHGRGHQRQGFPTRPGSLFPPELQPLGCLRHLPVVMRSCIASHEACSRTAETLTKADGEPLNGTCHLRVTAQSCPGTAALKETSLTH